MGHGAEKRINPWKSWRDIPDELVVPSSGREVDNQLFKTRRWYDFKKQQIWHQQGDGVPFHLQTPMRKFLYRSLWATSFGIFFYNCYLWNKHTKK